MSARGTWSEAERSIGGGTWIDQEDEVITILKDAEFLDAVNDMISRKIVRS